MCVIPQLAGHYLKNSTNIIHMTIFSSAKTGGNLFGCGYKTESVNLAKRLFIHGLKEISEGK